MIGWNTRARLAVPVMLACLIAAVAVASINDSDNDTFTAGKAKPSLDAAIIVNGNAQLAAIATDGNGTAGNPYIIENKDIDAGGAGSAIHIQNTDAHLVIRDCNVTGSGNYQAGIKLESVANVKVTGINASGNYHGMQVFFCTNATIMLNNASGNSERGIFTQSCTNTTISGTIVSHNNAGIIAELPRNTTISGNTVQDNNGIGIWIYGGGSSGGYNWAYNNNVSGNTVNRNNRGIVVYISNDTTISGNTVTASTTDGIHMQKINRVIISGNTVVNNQQPGTINGGGIDIIGSDDCKSTGNQITGNNVSFNDAWGIYISQHSEGNTISGNTLHNNTAGCIKDQGAGNVFNDNDCFPQPEVSGAGTWWLVLAAGAGIAVIAARKRRCR